MLQQVEVMSIVEKRLANLVLSGDATTAVELLLNRYNNDLGKAFTAYNTWKRIRSLLMKTPSVYNPEYQNQVTEWLAMNPELSPNDFETVGKFLQKTPTEQFHHHQKRARILNNFDHDKSFRVIKPFLHSFYDFVLPVAFIDANREQKIQRTRDRHYHMGKPACYFLFTSDEVATIRAKCLEVLERDTMTTNLQYYETFTALQIVSGRRNVEIQRELACRAVPDSEYQASVFGLAKNTRRGLNWVNIPLLCPFSLFEMRLDQLRLHAGMLFAKNSTIVSGLRNASRRLFGRMLVHTQKRNLYAELAWADRKTSRFMDSEEGCSKFTWVGNALGHEIDYASLGPTASYQILTIEPS